MAEFLTTHGVAYHIENIIMNAGKKLVLVSPYLQLSTTFFDRLKASDAKGVNIIIIYKEDNLKSEEKNKLQKLNHLRLYSCNNLHAKCYFNESEMVITSMNMYEFSEKNNREMGILVTRKTEPNVFDKAEQEVEFIIQSEVTGVEKVTKKTPNKFEQIENRVNEPLPQYNVQGYCIRCGNRIPLDSEHPLCDEDYKEWVKYKNAEFPEHFCHTCGKETKTSYEKPDCHSCWKKNS